jgi:diaminopimelate epimerase
MRFEKYQALGNDYLVFDSRRWTAPLSPSTIRIVCNRHFGIGADGVLLHEPQSEQSEINLRIMNPDGTEAEKSGNGLRIFARYLWDHRLVGDAPFVVATPGGAVRCQVKEQGRTVTVEMGQVRFGSQDIPVLGPAREVLRETLVIDGQVLEYSAATIGNPHCVVHRQQVSEADASALSCLE